MSEKPKPAELLRSAMDKLTAQELAVLIGFLSKKIEEHKSMFNPNDFEVGSISSNRKYPIDTNKSLDFLFSDDELKKIVRRR